MIQLRRISLLSFLGVCIAAVVYAQKPLVTAENRRALNEISAQANTLHQADQQKAIALAKQHGWVLKRKSRQGKVISLQQVTPLGFPVYVQTYNNTISAATTGTNSVQPGGSLGLNLSGSSTLLNDKLAIWDGGSVYAGHQEFAGKTITNPDGVGSNEHATHVAGTMVAKGVVPAVKGMAFNAATLLSYDFDNDVAEMGTAGTNLLLSNHSYGAIAGWNYNSDEGHWEWYGLPGDSVDYKFGFYSSYTQGYDRVAYNAPYYTIVVAAGNSRNDTGPGIGESYYGFRSRTDQTLVNQGPRPSGISSNNGYDVIPLEANAKNVITVGAVQALPFGPATPADVVIGSYSSWGPTDDGRIKPDLVGNGDNVLSTDNSGPTDYLTLSGTSMSAPNITGSLYLLQEYYAQKNSNNFMRSATLKALACHTAFDGGNIGPDYIYGWGLLDMRRAAQAITDNGTKSLILENTLQQGQPQTIQVTASGSGVLAATLAWTDPEGTITPDGTINDRSPKLVNDLDIRISNGSGTLLPWVLNPEQPGVAATKGDNIRDNIEQIIVDGATPGKTYTIIVSNKQTLQSGSQPYSLIVTGSGGSPYCGSAPVSSADSKITGFSLANINTTSADGCTAYTDNTSLTAQLEQGKTYPLILSLGTCGTNNNKIAKVYVDWNSNGNFTDAGELVATTGVINSTGTFTANVTVPVTVTPGNYSLMRVVLVETSNANEVTPCANYAKGETQDYRVQFVKTAIDAGVIDINDAVVSGTCAGRTNVTVTLKNFGTNVLTSVPVTVRVSMPNGSTVTLSGTYTGSLAPNAEDDYTLTNTFNTVAGATYTVTATTTLAGDAIAANNQFSINYVTGNNPAPAGLAAYYCNNSNQYLLTGAADGQLLWYANANDVTPIAIGANSATTLAPVNNTFYAGVNDFNATVGPATKNVFSGGGYNQYTPGVIVSTQIPLIIQSARLYVGNSGRVRFTVTNASGLVVSTTTIAVTATRSTPGAGAQPDDLNDQGAVYQLNLSLPAAGNYTINVAYLNGATLYRSNAGVTGYPFAAGSVFRISGNTGSAGAAAAYYYFYNMQVASSGCASLARVPVAVTRPAISLNGNVLTSNVTTGNQWYLNGKAIAGATGQTYTPQVSGSYQLQITLAGGCTLNSEVFVYIKPGEASGNWADINLSVFPVPASTQLTVALTAPEAGQLNISLVNTAGQTVYSNAAAVAAGNYIGSFGVANIKAGTYILKIQLGTKVYSSKVIITK
ncbi:hypothetical protein GCM10027037_18460 [Mucilaginibacter koreensis]